ncbi:eCIS core domain-containing protein [Piscinibacter sakaiensis]|uniref:eCIS core domain-containing protein n=1 Tax=Piscinibacter sakaiensis TaxID=1547922 RepID=UPI003AAF6BE0
MPTLAAPASRSAASENERRSRSGRSNAPPSTQPRAATARAPPAAQRAGLPRYLQRDGAGQPLPQPVRRDMEQRFGEPLGGVRVHADGAAAASARTIGARAYTHRQDVVFGAGAYDPQSRAGRGLLAHELTHVVQQKRAGAALQPSVADGGARRVPAGGDAAEREAELNARKVHTPAPLTATQLPTQAVQADLLDKLGDAAGAVGGAVVDAGGAVVDAGGAVVDAAGEAIGDVAMALVERVAPELAPIIRQGPMAWLRDIVAQAFDGIAAVLNRLDPSGTLAGMLELFTGLVSRAAGIVAALASGDCQPLLAAIGQLKNFVTEVAGEAWDRLSAFFAPVGQFFSDLWAGYGAPAVEWLQQFAGGVWESVQQFGTDIWNWTAPVRNAVGDAWGWVKEQLFGPEDAGSGDSSDGIIGWVTTKAGEAWDWVKEQTRPVWQPISNAADRVAELLPPPFLQGLGEQMQGLSAELETAEGAMEGGGAVAENRETLASVLPSVSRIIGGVRGVIVGAGQWLTAKIGSFSAGIAALMGALRGSSLLGALAGALGWLESAAERLIVWVQSGVGALFERVLGAFDALSPFVEAAAGVARRLIGVVGNLLRLPQLILSTVWEAIPCCIREPIKNFVLQQILGRIPVFGQFFTDPTLWPRVQATAMRILRQVFVDGDIPRAAWSFFQAVLGVLGVPAQLVVQILRKAATAIGDILTNPIGFLLNLLGAVRTGFGLFFSNILTHLLGGVTGWLMGQVRDAGITPPADFSLRSILGFVLDVLGVTAQRIWAKLERRLDPATVARLRAMLSAATGVWRFVYLLVTQGPAALWEEIQGQLGDLWQTVLTGVIGWISTRVIDRAVRWLMSLLDVTGIMPVINALIAIYNAIESFFQYLRQMLEIVSRVLDGILGIARGAIEAAAGFLEGALARALPVAIGFLANQFGLGRLGERIRELLERVQGVVDRALDWLVDRAIRLGQSLIALARRGASAVGSAVRNLREWWRNRFGFTAANGERHELYFTGEGAAAQLTIASEPKSFSAFLDEQEAGADAAKRTRIETARTTHRSLLAKMRTAVPAGAAAGAGPADADAAEIVRLTHELAGIARELIGGDAASASTAPVFGGLQGGMGRSVRVDRLTSVHPPGDQPSVSGGLWDTLGRRRQGGTTYYIMGHLLNHHLGGTGSSWANLTPMTGSMNTTFSSRFEERAKQRVHDQNVALRFEASVRFGRGARTAEQQRLRATANPDDALVADIIAAEQHVPTQVSASAADLGDGPPGTSPVAPFNETHTIVDDPDLYDVTGTPRQPAYVSEMSDAQLAQHCAVPGPPRPGFPNRPWRSVAALIANTGTSRNWDEIVASTNARLRLYRQ